MVGGVYQIVPGDGEALGVVPLSSTDGVAPLDETDVDGDVDVLVLGDVPVALV